LEEAEVISRLLMGIINVTPDSFSDGGVNFDAEAAIATGLRMLDDGADILDVGGESTRPGAEPISAEEEMRRVLPVVDALAKHGAVSIDTMKSEVAQAAIEHGATIVNDVTALADPAMPDVVARARCTVCLMHMQGNPRTMQANPVYENVVHDVRDFLLERAAFAQACGISHDKIWIDPGIGFGKTLTQNLLLLGHIDEFARTGYPVLIGVSRKSFLGRISDAEKLLPVEDRLEGTLAAQVIAQMKGATIIRAHDVKEARRAMDVAAAIQCA
jgi:dihydropteroate synthase